MDDGIPDSVSSLAGSLLIGAFINWGLCGVLAVQVYTYYIAFPNDRRFIKAIVYTVFLSEIVQTVLITRDAYAVFVTGFGNPASLDDVHTHWFTIPISGGIAGFVGQLFFAYRIYVISSTRTVPYIITILAVVSGLSAIAAAVQFFMAGSFAFLQNNTLISIGIWNGVGALCDVLIAIAVPCFLLRSGTGFSSTHVFITRLIRTIMETGILTAILSLVHLILYFIFTDSFIVAGVTIAKVYANTMLVILNNRMEIVDSREALRMALEYEKSFRNRAVNRIQVSRERMTIRIDDIPMERSTRGDSILSPNSVTSLAPNKPLDFETASTETMDVKAGIAY